MSITLNTTSSVPSAWSSLWAASTTGSINLASDDPVALCLRNHWTEQARWMSTCSSIVDVGSGPAVLARFVHGLQGRGNLQPAWTCIDTARVPSSAWADLPFTVVPRDGEDFSTAMPDHGPANALVSNFGLEYVAKDGWASGCKRWIAPGGRLSCVIHAKGSVIDSASGQGAADLGFALDETHHFAHARQLFHAMASAPSDPVERMMHAVDVRDKYNNAVNLLKDRMETRGVRTAVLMDTLQGVHALTRTVASGHLNEALIALDSLEAGFRAERARLDEMQHSAQSRDQMDDFAAQLQGLGFTRVECRAILCNLGTVAWALSAHAPT